MTVYTGIALYLVAGLLLSLMGCYTPIGRSQQWGWGAVVMLTIGWGPLAVYVILSRRY